MKIITLNMIFLMIVKSEVIHYHFTADENGKFDLNEFN